MKSFIVIRLSFGRQGKIYAKLSSVECIHPLTGITSWSISMRKSRLESKMCFHCAEEGIQPETREMSGFLNVSRTVLREAIRKRFGANYFPPESNSMPNDSVRHVDIFLKILALLEFSPNSRVYLER